MNAKPQSVSIERLSTAISDAVKSHPRLAGGDMRPGFIIDPGVFGYILRNPDLGLPIKDLQVLAGDITARAGIAGKPASVVIDGNIIFGFFPANEILTFER